MQQSVIRADLNVFGFPGKTADAKNVIGMQIL
jgi:hypothetical protein